MTRDTKLALIIGASVVLLVLLLIADHLAASNRVRAGAVGASLASAAPQADPILSVSDGRLRSISAAPDGASERTDARPATAGTPTRPSAQPPRSADTPNNPGGLTRALGTAIDATRDLLASDGMGPAHQPATASRDEDSSIPQITLGVPINTDPIEGSTQTHLVRRGDTLWSIAGRYYGGTHSLHTALARHNAERLAADGSLIIGTRLLIPDRRTLENPPSTRPSTRRANEPTTDRPNPTTPPATHTTYVVQSGDVLGTIAQRLLGTSRRWKDILELNRGQLDAPEDLRVGMTIRIPGD